MTYKPYKPWDFRLSTLPRANYPASHPRHGALHDRRWRPGVLEISYRCKDLLKRLVLADYDVFPLEDAIGLGFRRRF